MVLLRGDGVIRGIAFVKMREGVDRVCKDAQGWNLVLFLGGHSLVEGGIVFGGGVFKIRKVPNHVVGNGIGRNIRIRSRSGSRSAKRNRKVQRQSNRNREIA